MERIERLITIGGQVQLRYPRRWWQAWRRGWHRHVDGLGQRCWIRYRWSREEQTALLVLEVR